MPRTRRSPRRRTAFVLAASTTFAALALLGAIGPVGPLAGPAAAHAAEQAAAKAAAPAASGPAYTPAHPADVATDQAPLVVIGIGGIRWSDLSPAATPALWSLLQQGSAATVTIRSVYSATCPVDGWLTVSAGQRAADEPPPAGHHNPPACRPLTEPAITPATGTTPSTTPGTTPAAVSVPRWADVEHVAAGSNFDPQLGLLGDELAQGRRCATAIGPGAAIALADHTGKVARYLPAGSDLESTVRSQVGECPLTVVDAGEVRGPGGLPRGEPSNGIPAATQIAAVDAHVGQVLAATPAGATVLLAGLADSGRTPHLRTVMMRGPGFGPGILYAPSTRIPALLQLTDVTPTILAHEGLPIPDALGGTPLERRGPAALDARLQHLLDLDQASAEVHIAVPRFFTGLVLAQVVLYGFAALTLRRRWTGERGRERTVAALRRVAVIFGAVPIATFLANTVPWWRASHPMIALTLIVAAYALAIFAVAQIGPWRRHPLGDVSVVATATLLVTAVDVMTGSRLQTSSLMGLQPVVAGRFYGMGNVTYALFATAGILLATALADPLVRAGRRRQAAVIVTLVGLFTVVVDGWPAWGSDFGGPPASIPAFAFLTFAVLGLRLTWRKVLAIIAATVATVSVVSILDWLRPPESRSHLGRFVQTVIDGGGWDVIQRKLNQNLDILFSSILSVLVPVGVLFVILVLLRPSSWGAASLQRAFDRSAVLWPGLIAVLVIWVVGFALNDSGTAIPAVSATLAIPLVIATSISALQTPVEEAGGDDGAAPAPPAAPAPASPRPA